MYKDLEITKARFALISNTNMVEYACEIYKTIHKTEQVPAGRNQCLIPLVELKARTDSVMERYNAMMKSGLYQCASDFFTELQQGGECNAFSDVELEEYGVRVYCIVDSSSLLPIFRKLPNTPSS